LDLLTEEFLTSASYRVGIEPKKFGNLAVATVAEFVRL
jgi:hypothetical protein